MTVGFANGRFVFLIHSTPETRVRAAPRPDVNYNGSKVPPACAASARAVRPVSGILKDYRIPENVYSDNPIIDFRSYRIVGQTSVSQSVPVANAALPASNSKNRERCATRDGCRILNDSAAGALTCCTQSQRCGFDAKVGSSVATIGARLW